MNRFEVQKRAMKMALEVIKLTKLFPICQESKVASFQVIKSSTSTAANYRAAGRAKSLKDFIAKLGIAEEECDETIFWLEFSLEANLISIELVLPIKTEASEILAIIVASIKSAKQNLKN
jgi:four helix bundle protein